MVPSRRFQAWQDAERYLLGLGTNADALREIFEQFKAAGFVALTIAS